MSVMMKGSPGGITLSCTACGENKAHLSDWQFLKRFFPRKTPLCLMKIAPYVAQITETSEHHGDPLSGFNAEIWLDFFHKLNQLSV